MAGMHRDKCGAAAVAGFFKVSSFFFLNFLVTFTNAVFRVLILLS